MRAADGGLGGRRGGRQLVVVLTAGLVLTGCTGTSADESPAGVAVPPRSAGEPIAVPEVSGAGSIAPEVADDVAPSMSPVQAADDLAGTALPTSQWWTSALTGPLSQPLWAHPLAVRPDEDGVAVSSQPPTVSANAIITPFVPAVTVPGEPTGLTVTGYGAFDVRFDVTFADGTLGVTVVQGSPITWLSFRDGLPASVVVPEGAQLGEATDVGDYSLQRVVVGEATWNLITDAGTKWTRGEDTLTPDADVSAVAVAVEPDGAAPDDWAKAVTAAAPPVTGTREELSYDPAAGAVEQTLTMQRTEGTGLWALLPHLGAATTTEGTWPDQRGDLTMALGNSVTTSAPLPGLLTAVPDAGLDAAAREAVAAALAQDLLAPGTPGGSYFGAKELGRLALLAETATALGDEAARQQALDRLRVPLTDLLTYDGSDDPSYLAFDPVWGGIVAVPPEFGSQDYNDHHFHYGYVLYAAAVLGEADPTFVEDYRDVVDLLVRDFAGSSAAPGDGGLPPFRVWNAYEGHSAASGFQPFADGNNQESSGEAMHAWEGVVRWGLVTGEETTVQVGMTRYGWEGATTRRYWLGEDSPRPPGFDHTVIGILWGAKTDYATFFDPAPEAVEGIQLLPLTMGSFYRADPEAAAGRSAGLEQAVSGEPRSWGDLFAVDLALSDPGRALARLDAGVPQEPSTSAAVTRLMVELLARHGPPQPAVWADGPYGLAFGPAQTPTLVGTNPTAEPLTVTFRDAEGTVADLAVPPRSTTTARP